MTLGRHRNSLDWKLTQSRILPVLLWLTHCTGKEKAALAEPLGLGWEAAYQALYYYDPVNVQWTQRFLDTFKPLPTYTEWEDSIGTSTDSSQYVICGVLDSSFVV